ncbi:MAG: hypothetical protein FJY73_06845 [Candidatus Eisenbacteria bacterium]|nr:hypothetical protein [Candidatus Eisenbacteria bacterium]
MARTIVSALLLLALITGSALSESADWVRVTTWEGQEIALANFGFFRSSNWDAIADFRVDRSSVLVVYGGARTRISLSEIRSVTQDRPEFTSAFHGVVIEMNDGLRFRCEMVPETSGVAGSDQVGEVRIPGRKIKSIEFVRGAS